MARALGSWGVSVGSVGLALQLGSQKSYPATGLQISLRQNAFAIYVLHQVVVVFLAEVFVIGLDLSVAWRVGILTSLTCLVSVGLHKVICAVPLLPHIVFGTPLFKIEKAA